MFDHEDTVEAKEGRVNITNIEPEVFERLLNYMYAGTIPEIDELTPKLFIAADKVWFERVQRKSLN